MLKHEGKATVGDHIKAHDFQPDLKNPKTKYYIHGVVLDKNFKHPSGAKGYLVKVTKDVYQGDILKGEHSRVGKQVFVPHQLAIGEHEGRVKKLTKKSLSGITINHLGMVKAEEVEIEEANHPMAIHVKDVGKGKYEVKYVGKNVKNIKKGEKLTDTHLDDLVDMGHKIYDVKEDITEGKNYKVKLRVKGVKNSPIISGATTSGAPFKLVPVMKNGKMMFRKVFVEQTNEDQVNELSNSILGKYIAKAENDVNNKEHTLGSPKTFKMFKGKNQLLKKIINRNTGISRASSRMEEVQNVDEGKRGRPRKDGGEVGGGEMEADHNIIIHLRKAVNTGGKHDVEFKDGKKIRVKPEHAQALLDLHSAMNTKGKGIVQRYAGKSHAHMMELINKQGDPHKPEPKKNWGPKRYADFSDGVRTKSNLEGFK